jgi:aerobic carbon-monoxide dehydrogenase large subunit
VTLVVGRSEGIGDGGRVFRRSAGSRLEGVGVGRGAREYGFRLRRPYGTAFNPCHGDARPGYETGVQLDHGDHRNRCKVAGGVALLVDRPSGRAEQRQMYLRDDLVARQRRCERTLEEIERADPSFTQNAARNDGCVECLRKHAPLGRGIGMRHASRECASHADRHMPHESRGTRQEPPKRIISHGDLKALMAHEHSDNEFTVRLSDVTKSTNTVYVDQDLGGCEPEVHCRDEALTPSEDPGVFLRSRQRFESLVDVDWSQIPEGRGLHVVGILYTLQSFAPVDPGGSVPKTASGLIGTSPTRVDDDGLVRGSAAYVADLVVRGCLEACFVRSYSAHGLLRAVDTSRAGDVEGVIGAYSGVELPKLPDALAGARGGVPSEMARPSLARERVRFAGEPVAVVVARDRYAAEDGAERIGLEIEPLEVVLNPTAAAEDGATRIFDSHGNVASEREYGRPVDDVVEMAPVLIECDLHNERVAPTSIEARAVLVEPRDGRLTVSVSHQAPQRLRQELAAALGLDLEIVRVVVPKVGGAFGAKSQTFPEYIVVAYLARMLGRPIRWIEDRQEALQGATHGRSQRQHLRLAADRSGRILAVEALIDADVGAYPHTGGFVPSMTGWVLSGPYRIPRLYARIRSVVTNRTPTASYRGAGRPEAAFALERLVDKLARRLQLDPAEVRLRNFISSHEFPYSSPTGASYDSGDYAGALRQALDLVDYDAVKREQRRRRAAGGPEPLIGIGIASYVERAGGQSGSHEFGAVEITPHGTIVARSGSTSQGQGHETAFAQVVASAFDVELDRVRVVEGDTDEVPIGTGTFASRSMQVGGAALQRAAVKLLDEGHKRASARLEVAEEDLQYARGRFTVAGTSRSVGLVDLLDEGPLAAQDQFAPPQAFPFGTYAAVVEIDRSTGDVSVVRMAAVDDCGVLIHPKVVEGQIVGSTVQGVGQALYELIAYDDSGQPLFSSLMDYSIPTISEVPDVRIGDSVTPNPNTALGAKGAGETGCIGAPPAIVNAIVDALDGRDDGLDMPVTSEKIWRILRRRA